jgi:uncharacterized protein with ATP-grasp and redox domains
MKAYAECYPCFFNQVLKTVRLVTSDEKKVWESLIAVSSFLPRVSFDVPPPAISRDVYRIISEITGVKDPYLEDDRLKAAVRMAIAGNMIDFGVDLEFDFKLDVDKILSQELAVDDYPDFQRELKTAQSVLYLGDNAGETVFDRILIEEIGKPTVYAVRERPVINDLVYADAVAAGIDKVANIVSSGCDSPGTIVDLCSEEFLELLNTSDLVISKGQGNYEGLSDVQIPIFFLLKTKCGVIARHIGIPLGSVILMKSSCFPLP